MKYGIMAAVFFVVALAGTGHAENSYWKQIGPVPIKGSNNPQLSNPTTSGIINDIAIDRTVSNDKTIYIATGAGGVWKTTDGGSNWSPTMDSEPDLHIGAVALDPSDQKTVYAGIGGFWAGNASVCCITRGGLYQSIDAGRSWALLNPTTSTNPAFLNPNGIFTGLRINRIVLPKSGVVLLATSGGLFKSIDGGHHFGNDANFSNGNPVQFSTPGGTVSTNAISDLKLDTANPNTVYAAVHLVGLFKSTDAGTSFPATGALISSANFPLVIKSNGWITFGQSTSPNNKTIYVFLCPDSGGNTCTVLKSVNLGTSFQNIAPIGPKISVNQGDYDQITAVDPQNANGVYIGVRDLFYSANGGSSGFTSANWIAASGAHTDDHAIAFSSVRTGGTTRVYIGTDGGFSSTAANGSKPGSKWQFFNNGLATTLFFDMDFGRGDSKNNEYTYGALQDNGVPATNPGKAWFSQCCGDGLRVTVDPKNAKHALVSNDGGLNCTTDGQNWGAICTANFPAGGVGTGSVLRFDPNGANAYASSANNLYQSQDNAQTFPLMHTFPKNQNVVAIAQVKPHKSLLWIGLSDGTLAWTDSALQGTAAKWTAVSVTDAPTGQGVAGIAIDPDDNNKVFVTYAGFSDTADPPKHIFEGVHDESKNTWKWRNIGGTPNGGDNNIPDLPLKDVIIDTNSSPHTIIVGSDLGVFQSTDDGATWQVLGTGLPYVSVNRLQFDPATNLLRAATFGRSAYQLECGAPKITGSSKVVSGAKFWIEGCGFGTQGDKSKINIHFTETSPQGSDVNLDSWGGSRTDPKVPISLPAPSGLEWNAKKIVENMPQVTGMVPQDVEITVTTEDGLKSNAWKTKFVPTMSVMQFSGYQVTFNCSTQGDRDYCNTWSDYGIWAGQSPGCTAETLTQLSICGGHDGNWGFDSDNGTDTYSVSVNTHNGCGIVSADFDLQPPATDNGSVSFSTSPEVPQMAFIAAPPKVLVGFLAVSVPWHIGADGGFVDYYGSIMYTCPAGVPYQ